MSIAGYNVKTLVVAVPDPAGDAKIACLIAPAGGIRIVAAHASCSAAVAADAVNKITFSLLDGGADGTGTDALATRVGGAAVGWDANELHALTLQTQTELDEGAHLIAHYDESGAVAPGWVSFVVQYVQGGSE